MGVTACDMSHDWCFALKPMFNFLFLSPTHGSMLQQDETGP
jgi:hypothetical protein